MAKNIWKEAAKVNLKIEGVHKTFSFVALWGLPTESKVGESLESVYAKFKAQTKSSSKLSLTKRTSKDNVAELVVALVEDVYETRTAEREEATKKAQLKEKLALLEQLKEEKELEALKGKDTKSLEAEIAELRAALKD